jgi:hypothetical protein
MHKPSLFMVSLFATCCFFQTAQAANVRWKIGPEESARYRIATDAVVAGTTALQMPPALPLGPAAFKNGRTYSEAVNSIPNLIFHFTLSIPKKMSKKGAPVVDAFSRLAPYSIALKAIGKIKSKSNGSKLTIEGVLRLEPGTGGSSFYKPKIGALVWSTIFDTKKGCVISSNYEYKQDILYTYTAKGKTTNRNMKFASKGRIILLEKGKRNPAKIRDNIKTAIKKGVEYLKKTPVTSSGATAMGYQALKLFALLRSGVSAKDPVIQTGLKKIAAMKLGRTYDVSLYIMVLEALSVTRKPPARNSSMPRYIRGRVGRDQLKKIQACANWLINGRNVGKGTWHYTAVGGAGEGAAPKRTNAYDNSNTQFAVLALHAAHRAGAKIDPVVWREIFTHFQSVQCKSTGQGRHDIGMSGESEARKRKRKKRRTTARSGNNGTRGGVPYRGWSYGAASTAYGSMTNAGLSSLAIAADMLKSHRKFTVKDNNEFTRMVAEGLHWQAQNYSITKNPGQSSSSWYYYYMYSLEKACELIGVDLFDKHDWYLEGADYICALQAAAGSWNRSASDTALALLFLNRATLRTTVNILPGRQATGEGAGPADPNERSAVLVKKAGGLISLNNLLQSLSQASGSQKSKMKRWFAQGITKLDETHRPVVMPDLIKLLKDRKFSSWAKKQLRFVTQDSRLGKAQKFEQWFDNWEAMDTAAYDHAYNRINLLREIISKNKSRLLRKVAMLAAVRLRAVELAEDIAPLLSNKRERSLARDCLSVLIGKKPDDEAEVSAWAEKNLKAALKKEQPKRFVSEALRGDDGKRKTLVAAGKTYLPQLVLLARDGKYGFEVCALLTKITGEKHEAREWSNWWRKNKEKIGKDGRLPKAKKVKSPTAKSPAVGRTP